MHWIEEDYELLARIIEAGNRFQDNEVTATPGRLVRTLRRGLQWSQLDLAERAGMPRSLVGRLEAGRDVQLSSILRLLKTLGCGIVFLPHSQELLAQFKTKARNKRRGDREWKRMVSRLNAQAPARADASAPGPA